MIVKIHYQDCTILTTCTTSWIFNYVVYDIIFNIMSFNIIFNYVVYDFLIMSHSYVVSLWLPQSITSNHVQK